MHRYLAGDEDRRKMLQTIGAGSVEELFASIPASLRCGVLPLPQARSEEEVRREFWALATANLSPDCVASFLGAGVYRHVTPAAADAILQRGEFFTAYTPYQPEISQGTLQAVFEFQTFTCQLTEEDVANASMYDGPTAVVEAVLLTRRVGGNRNRVVVPATLHPEIRMVLDTYCEAQGITVTPVAWDKSGRLDFESLKSAVGTDVCAVVVQSPNFFGVVEDLEAVGQIAQERGALAVHAVLEASSLGVLVPGGRFGFDVVCGDMQAFGVPASFGGPYLGFFAARQKHVRQMPGRLVGETVDRDGKRGFVLTLSTREQHIRRAKATSNICTNHGLIALYVAIVLALLGKRGVREVALASYGTSQYLKEGIKASGSKAKLGFPDGPTYNEFLLVHRDPDGLLAKLRGDGILGGVSTSHFPGTWPRGILVAATEQNTKDECDRLISALGRLS